MTFSTDDGNTYFAQWDGDHIALSHVHDPMDGDPGPRTTILLTERAAVVLAAMLTRMVRDNAIVHDPGQNVMPFLRRAAP